MPFDKLEKFKDHAHYKSVLKAELQKLGATPVKYHYFEKFKFQDGSKEGDPFVAVGFYSNAFIDQLKSSGAVYKARGRIVSADGEPTRFTVEHGAMTDSKLNLALKEGLAMKAEFVDSLGEDEGDAAALAKARATYDKLQALRGKVGQTLSRTVHDAIRLALATADEALTDQDLLKAEQALGEARMRLESYVGQAASDKQMAADKGGEAAVVALEKADSDVAKVPDLITAHAAEVTRLANITKGLNNTKEKFQTNSWKQQVAQNEKDVAAATVKSQRLAARLADAQELLRNDSERATRMRTELATQLRELKEAQDALKRLTSGLDDGPPGRVADNPSQARARDALAQKMAPIAKDHADYAKAVTQIERVATELRRRFREIGNAVKLDADCEEGLVDYETEVQALLDDLPDDDSFATGCWPKAAPIAAWLAAREKLLQEFNERKVNAKYAEWRKKNPQDGSLVRARERLDEMLAGARTPTAAQIRKVMIVVAPQDDGELLDRIKQREGSVDEAAQWGSSHFGNALAKEVWSRCAKAAKSGGQPETIKGKSLETVEAAIEAWYAARHDAPLAVSNMHVPGGGRPQYKADKNVTRPDIQANFMSAWNGRMINMHVEIVTSNAGDFYDDKNGRVNDAVINQLVAARRLNRGQ